MEKNNKEEQNITWASVKKFVTGCFSFQGFYDGVQFVQAMVFGACIKDLSVLTDNIYIKMVFVLCGLYVYFASFQKRCRDLNIKGTFVIVIAATYFLIVDGILDIKKINWGSITVSEIISVGIFLVYVVVFAYLLLKVGKKEKNAMLVNSVLKYPKLYFVFYCVIFVLVRNFITSYQ